jgi:hypothetical protein
MAMRFHIVGVLGCDIVLSGGYHPFEDAASIFRVEVTL